MEKTIKNLSKAFVGESQARNRYTIYAKIAQKEGYDQLSEIFLITADNEREHAKWLFRMINQLKAESSEDLGEIEVDAGVETTLGNTVENLNSAINGENYEYTTMYPEFADIAEEEGYSDIAKRLRAIGEAEIHHEERFKKFLKEIEAKTLFEKSESKEWFCRKCGYMHTGNTPPEECPSCNHPTEYFQLKCEEY